MKRHQCSVLSLLDRLEQLESFLLAPCQEHLLFGECDQHSSDGHEGGDDLPAGGHQ